MRICFACPGRSGKSEAATWLSRNTSLTYIGGTSWWFRHFVWQDLQAMGIYYRDAEVCYADRHSRRELWADIIGKYVRPDPASAYAKAMTHQSILEGIRRPEELLACKRAGLFDLIVYIDRPNCVDPTCQVTQDDCDVTIRNYGTLEEFHERLRRFASVLNFGLTRTEASIG